MTNDELRVMKQVRHSSSLVRYSIFLLKGHYRSDVDSLSTSRVGAPGTVIDSAGVIVDCKAEIREATCGWRLSYLIER